MIVEVGLRDGLQNEPTMLSTRQKVELARGLVDAGLRRLEVASFVNPRLVPAMADAEAVLAAVPRRPGVRYAGLVLNRRGLDRALAADVDEVNVVVCASDTFSLRNQNAKTYESMATAVEVIEHANVFTTLTVATAFGCPFEGEVPVQRVIDLAWQGIDAGVDEVCFADTIGVGVPVQVAELADAVRDAVRLRFHFHNTRNTGFANAWTALGHGATALDGAIGGIGGCPFAPRATGNIGTDDLTYLLERSGVDTGLDLDALVSTARALERLLGRQVPSLLPRAGGFPPAA
jgi:hydroxymethylglutaryl-CoA lyase